MAYQKTMIRSKPVEEKTIAFDNKRCSCYDSECRDVVNHFVCFMGDDYVGGVADGYCPWLR